MLLTLNVEAVKFVMKLMQTGELGALTKAVVQPLPTWTDTQLREYVHKNINSAWHPVGP